MPRREAIRALNHPVIGNQTFEAGGLSGIAQLQLENARLRKLMTDLSLEKMRSEDDQAVLRKGAAKGKPANKRGAV